MHDNVEPIEPTDRTDASLLLRLEHAIADLLTDASTPEEFFEPLLAAIGSALGWPVGAVWTLPERPDDEQAGLRCAVVWHNSDDDVAEFAAASYRLTLPSGAGLPGRVWSTGKPLVLPDVVADGNVQRPDGTTVPALQYLLDKKVPD